MRAVSLVALLLAGCWTLEPEDHTGFVVRPLEIEPDSVRMTINERVWIGGQRPGVQHTVRVKRFRPELRNCGTDCGSLIADGWMPLDEERVEELLHDGACGVEAPPVGESIVIGMSSCFSLTKLEHFWDLDGLAWPVEGEYGFRPLRCGRTWAGYRLKEFIDNTGKVTRYPTDDVFSDTLWIDVVGC